MSWILQKWYQASLSLFITHWIFYVIFFLWIWTYIFFFWLKFHSSISAQHDYQISKSLIWSGSEQGSIFPCQVSVGLFDPCHLAFSEAFFHLMTVPRCDSDSMSQLGATSAPIWWLEYSMFLSSPGVFMLLTFSSSKCKRKTGDLFITLEWTPILFTVNS